MTPYTTSVLIGDGDCCKQCGCKMQKWGHTEDFQPAPGSGWYEYWYKCANPECSFTTVHAPGAFRHPDAEKQQRVNYASAQKAKGNPRYQQPAKPEHYDAADYFKNLSREQVKHRLLDDFNRLLVIEKFEFDPMTKKCLALGKAR